MHLEDAQHRDRRIAGHARGPDRSVLFPGHPHPQPAHTGLVPDRLPAGTLVFLGWYVGAQLSVVNLLALASALATTFSWDAFLLDPLVFLLWFSVAAALILGARPVLRLALPVRHPAGIAEPAHPVGPDSAMDLSLGPA